MSILNFLYFIMVYFIELGFFILVTKYFYVFLDNNVDNFHNISPVHKKWYVTNNLVKSFIFSFLSYHSYFLLKSYVVDNHWNNIEFQYLGCLYASIDMGAIIIVPKLSKNTLYHHIVVNILLLYALTNEMNINSFSLLIVIYALFSVLAFSVNFYLGMRILIKNPDTLSLLSSFCFINYIMCCVPNWSFQFYNLYFNDKLSNVYGIYPRLLFGLIILIIVYDDLVLMKYLKDNSIFKNILEDGFLNLHNIQKLKILTIK